MGEDFRGSMCRCVECRSLSTSRSKRVSGHRLANIDGIALASPIINTNANSDSDKDTDINTDADSILDGYTDSDNHLHPDTHAGNTGSGDQCRDARSLCRSDINTLSTSTPNR